MRKVNLSRYFFTVDFATTWNVWQGVVFMRG